jgi:hypothetical protein
LFPGHGPGGRGTWVASAAALLLLVAVFYLLQSYRDATRYTYYSRHSDHQGFIALAITQVGAWDFLDRPDAPKTIALSMDPATPLGYWLFYPLMGRHLQNDVVYVSAKDKWDVPAWVDRGMLRGNDYSVWLHNVKRLRVDYIMLAAPWPLEYSWMSTHKDVFTLIFSDSRCKVYAFAGDRS